MANSEYQQFMRTAQEFLQHMNQFGAAREQTLTPLGDVVSEHLGVDASTVAVVQEELGDHRLVDADLALDEMGAGGRTIGVAGGDNRNHLSLPELISNPHSQFTPGPVDFSDRATGPNTTRRVVTFGLRLLTYQDHPIAVLQRGASPMHGQADARLETLGAEPDVVSDFLRELRSEMVRLSVLRGKVLTFHPTQYGAQAGATFLERPDVAAEDIVLADGVLDEVTDHVVGIGEHRAELLAAGQHLKRGVLLYGPPGTGKTLTVRHLLSRTEGTTAVLLTGSSIGYITQATEIARTFEPSIVVLEDIDLVAMERGMSPQPLLFEVLDALDGLDGDADVAFVMTTNRVEVLEKALAERPGRVDLAVEIPLPATLERERLFRCYANGLPFSDEALTDVAAAAEGTTGSFAKELMRRSVLRAAKENREANDGDLLAAFDDLMGERAQLTRRILGSGGPVEDGEGGEYDDGGGESFGWFAYAPGSGSTFRPEQPG